MQPKKVFVIVFIYATFVCVRSDDSDNEIDDSSDDLKTAASGYGNGGGGGALVYGAGKKGAFAAGGKAAHTGKSIKPQSLRNEFAQKSVLSPKYLAGKSGFAAKKAGATGFAASGAAGAAGFKKAAGAKGAGGRIFRNRIRSKQ